MIFTFLKKISSRKTSYSSIWLHDVWVFSCVRLFATPRTVACQAPLSVGFPGKNTRGGCYCLLQEIFPTIGWNLSFFCLLLDWWILYHFATREALRSLFSPLLNQRSSSPAFLEVLSQTITTKLLDWGRKVFLWVCCCCFFLILALSECIVTYYM